jgi:UrcA family protein
MNTVITCNRLRGLIATAIFSALASGLAAVCAAADRDSHTMIVKYADLTVSDPQGAAALYGRISAVAHRVCSNLDPKNLILEAYKDDCVRETIASAVTKVNQPQLFAIYRAKNGLQVPKTLVSQNH